LRERSCIFVSESITEGFFSGLRKINCISPYGEFMCLLKWDGADK
jgi:hypothetical protein